MGDYYSDENKHKRKRRWDIFRASAAVFGIVLITFWLTSVLVLATGSDPDPVTYLGFALALISAFPPVLKLVRNVRAATLENLSGANWVELALTVASYIVAILAVVLIVRN